MEDFYHLSRALLVKDEKYYDRFDRAFGSYFEGLDSVDPNWFNKAIPEEWLRKELEKTLSAEEFAKLQGLGSLEKILEEFRKRLEEQHKRHQGGNKMIGDRKSTRLNSSHVRISYAVFCLKKKTKKKTR